jgi:hypothetical protein
MSEHRDPNAEHQQLPEQERAEVLDRFAEHPFANLETYKYFNQKGPEAAQARKDFVDAAMAGNTPDAPASSYPNLDTDTLIARRDELTEMLDDVLRLDMDIEENRLLREKITDRVHEVGIMLLTKIQSDMDPNDVLYDAVSYQLGENMREVYGTPAPEHWRGILGYRLSLLAEVEEREDVPDAVRDAWQYIRDALPQDLPIEKPYQPRAETMQWYGEQLDARMAPAKAAVAEAIEAGDVSLNEEKMNGENIVKAAKIALAARNIEGWNVVLTDEANIDTSQEHQTIFIPDTYEMTMEEFDSIMQSHEIDEHVARRDNGDKSGEPILGGTGCAGYLAWEEGNGKANEALLRGKVSNEDSAFKHYLSGGLALGLDGQGGRNFGETFDLAWRMRYVANYLNDEPIGSEDEQRELMEKTVDDVRRLYRGTDGRAPGVILPKDATTYYLGQTDVWRKWDKDMKLPEAERRAEHELERSAKINPLRPDHRRVARRVTSAA